MIKKIIVTILSILIINNYSMVSVFADTNTIKNNAEIIPADEFQEPLKRISYDKDMSFSYYIWNKAIVTYVFHNDVWIAKTWEIIGRNGETLKIDKVNKVEPYPLDVLPRKGNEGEEIQRTFYVYMGQGLKPELILERLNKLECELNKLNNQNI